ncbi:type II toxin-antitoxin system Phd/YefM family antitoxin [Sphingomonas corticis]|jgi:prevent-host-death family protein|uniref:Antitoxin n=1 Tax=Sphingomonas corticis TaxID=2722791 RepID=A0ABX1CQX1_9SPHN|nr:type II toxin-antitoxin system Phd/YefM family antitoxin [Sphingomonas corticis]NJR80352.1 type II toxin-antitoxin system Phd/YefM family antitoxin [Sphingomonas corticis]
MGMLERIKPVSWFKANAAEVLRNVAEDRTPYIITQNGEAKAVVVDIASYEATQETLALLKLVQLGREDVKAGRVRPLRDVIEEMRQRTRDGQ